jgi:hypothetical protein
MHQQVCKVVVVVMMMMMIEHKWRHGGQKDEHQSLLGCRNAQALNESTPF